MVRVVEVLSDVLSDFLDGQISPAVVADVLREQAVFRTRLLSSFYSLFLKGLQLDNR